MKSHTSPGSLLRLLVLGCRVRPRRRRAAGRRSRPRRADGGAPATAPRSRRRVERRVNGVRVAAPHRHAQEMGAQMGTICGEDVRYSSKANLKKIPGSPRTFRRARRRGSAPSDPRRADAQLRATAIAAGVTRTCSSGGDRGRSRRGDACVRRRRGMGAGDPATRRSSVATSTGTTTVRCTNGTPRGPARRDARRCPADSPASPACSPG